jgi:hypothetical protein
MEEKVGPPRSYTDFRNHAKPILARLGHDCIRYEKTPRRSLQIREIIDFIQDLLKFAERRDDSATNLRTENARLKAQVVALQAVLAPIVAASKGTTQSTTSAPQIPADETEPKEVVP